MIIDCPSCSRKLRVPDDLLGKQVKCPTCGHTFGAAATQIAETAAPSTGAPVNLQLDALSSSTEPTQEFQAPTSPSQPAKPAVEGTVLQPCPNCDKLIEPDAGRCPYCGEVPQDFFEEDDRPWEHRGFRGRRDAEPHRGSLILTLGIISIVLPALGCGPFGLPLGIAAWVMGQKDLRKMRENVMDPEGMGSTQAGWICGIIGTILDSLCTLGVLAYIAFIFTMVNTMQNMPNMPKTTTIKKTAPVVVPQKKAEADFVPLQLKDYLPPANC